VAGSRVHDRQLLTIGAVCAAGGAYFILVGLGLAPPPSKINGPMWLSTCVGLVFLAGSVMVLVRGWLGVRDSEELPVDAPRALVALQWLAVVACCGGLASAATWVAFGEGSRQFVLPLPLPGDYGELLGRAAFGLGAIMSWMIALAMAHIGMKKLFNREG
jgi:hypothetical protein